MAKIYYRRYKSQIRDGLMTISEAIEDAETAVPNKYRAEVIAMLEADLPSTPEDEPTE